MEVYDYVIEIHIADLHFGATDPQKQYTILKEQFINKLYQINFDILSIDGDIFDRKYMANSPVIYYAMEFIRECAVLCSTRNATMVIIGGTESHDAGQLQLFYNYKNNTNLDIRIVESTRFEYIKGLKVLCIPEEYNKGADYYYQFLDEIYDTVFMHGTVVGSVYGANKENLSSTKYPVFSIESFCRCKGPIICGHVHKAMCLNSYIYYCSNPIRYKFGEEEDKGFCIVIHDKKTFRHSFNFIPIESFRYDTIDIKSLEYGNPDNVVGYLNNLLANGIDHIRLDFSSLDEPVIQSVIEQYYNDNPNVCIKRYEGNKSPRVDTTPEIENKYAKLDFLLDPNLDSYSKFVHFINHNMGKQFITVEKLKSVLSGEI